MIIYITFVFQQLTLPASLPTACALQFLNERNISHLDLKPQNILLHGSVLKLAGYLTLPPAMFACSCHLYKYLMIKCTFELLI